MFINLYYIILGHELFIGPAPKSSSISEVAYPLAKVSLNCSIGNEQKCPDYVHENFLFYQKLMYDRDTPYTTEELKLLGVENPVNTVFLTIKSDDESIDVLKTSEDYTLVSNSSGIYIMAETVLASSRAFSTMMQITWGDKNALKDKKRYQVHETKVTDSPSLKWRHFSVDATSHYIKLQSLKRLVDAASMQKLNILIVKMGDGASFPLAFEKAPQSKLVSGSWSPYHYYSMDDLKQLQTYGRMRGVVVMPQIEMPGHAASWRYADVNLVADCKVQAQNNVNLVVLNVLNDQLVDKYIKGMLQEIFDNMFPKFLKIRPMIHLGGQAPGFDCWKADESFSDYIQQNVGVTYESLWKKFFEDVDKVIQNMFKGETLPYVVNAQDSLDFFKESSEHQIVHLLSSQDKQRANAKKVKVISSVNWFLNLMHPGGGHHYFWQDTWHDLYRQNPLDGADTNLKNTVGGGAIQPNDNSWDQSIDQHSFDRGLGVAEVLWSKGGSNVWGDTTRRLEYLGCKLYKAGIGSGPLDIGKPCFGYVMKWDD